MLAGEALREWTSSDAADFDDFLTQLDNRHYTQVDEASDYHTKELESDIKDDLVLLERLRQLAAAAIREPHDQKTERLIGQLRHIAEQATIPTRDGVPEGDRRKTVVFSSFADTIDDLRERVVNAIGRTNSDDPLSRYADRVAPAVFGSKSGADQQTRARILAAFAPETIGGTVRNDLYDLLFTTDVLSEGVNLQQAGRIINYDLPWNPMRVVQRHGRVDRIGSKHPRVFLDCFFPAENLDRLLNLEETLQRKIAQADAAIGTGSVLPGFEVGEGQIFADNPDQIRRIYDEDASILDSRSHHAALSGEEYRQRLRSATGYTPNTERVQSLPYGSGSGFKNMKTTQSGYVFCARINNQPKPRFRFVPVDSNWQVKHDKDGHPIVVYDTLTALIAADPEQEDTPRSLADGAYAGAFDAWEAAHQHIYTEHQLLADPAALQPDVPKALRDARQLAIDHKEVLTVAELEDLSRRLNTSPPVRTQRQIRTILKSEQPTKTIIDQLYELAKEQLHPPTPPPDIPPITPEDIQLVTWMAVEAGLSKALHRHPF